MAKISSLLRNFISSATSATSGTGDDSILTSSFEKRYIRIWMSKKLLQNCSASLIGMYCCSHKLLNKAASYTKTYGFCNIIITSLKETGAWIRSKQKRSSFRALIDYVKLLFLVRKHIVYKRTILWSLNDWNVFLLYGHCMIPYTTISDFS